MSSLTAGDEFGFVTGCYWAHFRAHFRVFQAHFSSSFFAVGLFFKQTATSNKEQCLLANQMPSRNLNLQIRGWRSLRLWQYGLKALLFRKQWKLLDRSVVQSQDARRTIFCNWRITRNQRWCLQSGGADQPQGWNRSNGERQNRSDSSAAAGVFSPGHSAARASHPRRKFEKTSIADNTALVWCAEKQTGKNYSRCEIKMLSYWHNPEVLT